MWICCQIGAREHYAVPRVLHRNGRLARLYTGFWAGKALRSASKMEVGRWGAADGSGKMADRNGRMRKLRALAGRHHPELDRASVKAWNFRVLAGKWKVKGRRQKPGGRQKTEDRSPWSVVRSPYPGFIEVGRAFACAVRDSLRKWHNPPADAIVFAYDTGALELFEWCRERGIRCVLDQMDPNRVEAERVREEAERWPGWAAQTTKIPEEYFQRREQEWALADRIIVNSEWSRKALVKQGVAPEKLVVVPLAYEMADERWEMGTPLTPNSDLQPSNTFRVLFLGQVILRKGIQYLMEAARKLEKENIQFDVVGPVGISKDAVASAPGNMIFHGPAIRDEAASWYRKSDLFVLPTLSDGFGITQLEAMSHGLPVVTTPCCGDVVSDGMDGFIVPPQDAGALAKTIGRYLAEPDLLRTQSQAALVKSKQFTLERLGERLGRLEGEMGG
jgi:glycosyltransferase involved in cell wall biosynthesis